MKSDFQWRQPRSWERSTPDQLLAAAAARLLPGGVLSPVQPLAKFCNPRVLTVALLFVLIRALSTTGPIRWFGDAGHIGRSHGCA